MEWELTRVGFIVNYAVHRFPNELTGWPTWWVVFTQKFEYLRNTPNQTSTLHDKTHQWIHRSYKSSRFGPLVVVVKARFPWPTCWYDGFPKNHMFLHAAALCVYPYWYVSQKSSSDTTTRITTIDKHNCIWLQTKTDSSAQLCTCAAEICGHWRCRQQCNKQDRRLWTQIWRAD